MIRLLIRSVWDRKCASCSLLNSKSFKIKSTWFSRFSNSCSKLLKCSFLAPSLLADFVSSSSLPWISNFKCTRASCLSPGHSGLLWSLETQILCDPATTEWYANLPTLSIASEKTCWPCGANTSTLVAFVCASGLAPFQLLVSSQTVRVAFQVAQTYHL